MHALKLKLRTLPPYVKGIPLALSILTSFNHSLSPINSFLKTGPSSFIKNKNIYYFILKCLTYLLQI